MVNMRLQSLLSKIPLKQYRMLAGWMAIHEDELYEAWNQAVRNIPFNKTEDYIVKALIFFQKYRKNNTRQSN